MERSLFATQVWGRPPWQVRFLSLPLMRVWSNGYDAWLPPKRPGFNSPHPHLILGKRA